MEKDSVIITQMIAPCNKIPSLIYSEDIEWNFKHAELNYKIHICKSTYRTLN